MSKKNKDIVNTNKITINLADVTKEKKEKKRRKKLRRRLLKKQEKELKQAKPAFSNFQYPQPIIINPEKQKQLNLDYDTKLSKLLQTKFDEEYAKRENEKATKKQSEPIQENVGAFNAVFDGRGFSQTTDLLSKANNNYRTAQLNTETDNLYNNNKPFLSVLSLPNNNIYNAEPVVVKAQKEVDHFCPICGKGYRSEGTLKNHISKTHPNETPAKQINDNDMQSSLIDDSAIPSMSVTKKNFVLDFADDEPYYSASPLKTVRHIRQTATNNKKNPDSSMFTSPRIVNEEPKSEIDKALNPTIQQSDDKVENDITSALTAYNSVPAASTLAGVQPEEQPIIEQQPAVVDQPVEQSIIEPQPVDQSVDQSNIEPPIAEPQPVVEKTQPPEKSSKKSKTISESETASSKQKTTERIQLKATINQLAADRKDELHKAFYNKIISDAMTGSQVRTDTLRKYSSFLQNAKKNGALNSKDFDLYSMK